MDDGSTGCALQRVSKHFRELSKYSRFTSVCLYRSKDILRFEAAVIPLPPNERRVRYLHITSPHLFLDVSEEELEDDGGYKISDSGSSFDNDNSFPTEGNPGDVAEMGNVEMDVDESDSDDDECRTPSSTEESEVDDDVAYFISSATSSVAVTSQLEVKDTMGEYMAEMRQANSMILSSVKQIISTLSSTLYALSVHWTKESNSGYLSIPDFIPSSTSLPCLTELYLYINIRSYTAASLYTSDPTRQDTFPALRRLRFAGLAWSGIECPYDMVKRMAPNLTHIRTDTNLTGTAFGPFTFPTNLKVFIEVPGLPEREEDVEYLMNERDFVRNLGYDPSLVRGVGMRIPEAYDAHCWENHWEAGLKGEPGHWLPELWAHEEWIERHLLLARKAPYRVPPR
ncbi:hypothetical protein K443DRAFT_686066 [Laccaria amethystina LaAM-08-1]|uniref:Uncharacterized protein n=1 Tax=Laccaria amethystina LaAM-08-1 TaxID=1095629 RepID=A0A0C9WHL5_9AGAR|nr:hypothetical protein K443DRAFT_686066 [Laccaria amethystina LaAM-08-1]